LARYRFTGTARRDLAAIRQNYRERQPRARIRLSVVSAIGAASSKWAPAQGRIREVGPPIAGEVRSVPVSPYVVFYRIVGNVVQVLRVVDGRRDLGTVFFSE
jgi:plasmid stabilization system protein ParE